MDEAPGAASIVPDSNDPQGLTMIVGGVPSSYVHLADPLRLEFEYVRWAGDLIDILRASGEPLHTVHVGGAGCTLARYVAATRPRSRQVVLENDAAVIALARATFGYSRRSGFRLREADGLAGLDDLPDAAFDLLIRDAFAGNTTPGHLQSRAFVGQVARVLAGDGVYLANIADQPGIGRTRREVATASAIFPHLALVGETQHLRGRRYGNVLLVASRQPLPLAELTRRVVSGPVPARVVAPSRVRALSAGAQPFD